MKDFTSEFDKELKPVDYINLMFENTNEKGVLYIPGWYYLNEPNYSLRCKIKWNYKDLEQAIFEFNELENKIEKIAQVYRKAGNDVSNIKELLVDSELFPVYAKYFMPFRYLKATDKEIEDIADKIDTIKTVKTLEHKMWSNEDIEAYEKQLYQEYKDLKISKEESDLYSDYCRAFYDDCEERLGSNVGAVDLLLRARRLCKVMEIEAPKQIINQEACMLAAAYVVHKYATSMEKVNDSVRINTEKLSFMSEEEEEEYLDSLYRPKKRNNRKQMLSLFVYRILTQKTNPDKPMSQQEIINELQEMPYELTIERKALSRVIHGLEEEMMGIHSDPRGGAWYDQDDDEFGLISLDE